MDRPQALITYDGLPKSSGGAHRIRVGDHCSVWNAVAQFLQDFTDYTAADYVHLVLFEGTGVEAQFFTTALERATQKYGEPLRRLYVSGAGMEVFENKWILGTADLPAATDFLGCFAPLPEQLGGAMFLGMQVRFKLRDLETSELLPFQGSDIHG
jgi:hypothetical protein